MKNLEKKIFVITGAASGLGSETARQLAKHKARLLLLDVNEEAGMKLEQGLNCGEISVADDLPQEDINTSDVGSEKKLQHRSHHQRIALFVACNIISEMQVADALQRAKEYFKCNSFHGLINCAAVYSKPIPLVSPHGSPLSLEKFRKMFEVNVIGNFNVVRLVAQEMKQNHVDMQDNDGERGIIIQTSSIAAYGAANGIVPYAGTKGAISSMTLPMARELGKYGIRVVSIAPGVFDTPMASPFSSQNHLKRHLQSISFPMRMGRAEEYAAIVIHVIQNKMINGSVPRIHGGFGMSSFL